MGPMQNHTGDPPCPAAPEGPEQPTSSLYRPAAQLQRRWAKPPRLRAPQRQVEAEGGAFRVGKGVQGKPWGSLPALRKGPGRPGALRCWLTWESSGVISSPGASAQLRASHNKPFMLGFGRVDGNLPPPGSRHRTRNGLS